MLYSRDAIIDDKDANEFHFDAKDLQEIES